MKNIVLIVDDEKSLRDALKIKLEAASDFSVDMAENGMACIETLKSNPVDLVVLDVMMPEMNGVDVAKEILKMKDGGHDIPEILMLTNDDDSEKILELMTLGINHYLVKSNYSLEDIVEKIRNLLSPKHD